MTKEIKYKMTVVSGENYKREFIQTVVDVLLDRRSKETREIINITKLVEVLEREEVCEFRRILRIFFSMYCY